MIDNEEEKPSGKLPFNQETKLEKYYKPDKMRNCLFKMEQFFLIWQNPETDEKHKRAAKSLFEHYRRLALCVLAKEMSVEHIDVEQVLTQTYIDTMFRDCNPYFDPEVASEQPS